MITILDPVNTPMELWSCYFLFVGYYDRWWIRFLNTEWVRICVFAKTDKEEEGKGIGGEQGSEGSVTVFFGTGPMKCIESVFFLLTKF